MADVGSPSPVRPSSSSGSCLGEWLKPRALYAMSLSFCWVLSVVAATEPVWEEFRGPQHVKQTLWQVCFDDQCKWGEYGRSASWDDCSLGSKYRAARAFATLVCLSLAILVIIAIARAMLPSVELKFTTPGVASKIYFWTLALTTFFSFMAWPLIFSLYAGPGCSNDPPINSLPYSILGSSGMFFLNVFIILMICLVLECVRIRNQTTMIETYPTLE